MKREHKSCQIKIGGYTPFSMTDYPDKISSTIFCQGCNLNCEFCHNKTLIPMCNDVTISFEEVIKELRKRSNVLDAVVFSGGEPLLHKNLYDSIKYIKDDVKLSSYLVGLHTNGVNVVMLKKVLPLIDWVGIDYKANRDCYSNITGTISDDYYFNNLESIKEVINSGVDYEVRTTLYPKILTPEILKEMVLTLLDIGVKTYTIQVYRVDGRGLVNLDLYKDVIDFCKDNFEKFIVR